MATAAGGAIAISNSNQTLEIRAAGNLTIGAAESVTNGTIQVDGGTLTVAPGLTIGTGAVLIGMGTVAASTAIGGFAPRLTGSYDSTALAEFAADGAGSDVFLTEPNQFTARGPVDSWYDSSAWSSGVPMAVASTAVTFSNNSNASYLFIPNTITFPGNLREATGTGTITWAINDGNGTTPAAYISELTLVNQGVIFVGAAANVTAGNGTNAVVLGFSPSSDRLDLSALLSGVAPTGLEASGLSAYVTLGASVAGGPNGFTTRLSINGPGGTASVCLDSTVPISSGNWGTSSQLHGALTLTTRP